MSVVLGRRIARCKTGRRKHLSSLGYYPGGHVPRVGSLRARSNSAYAKSLTPRPDVPTLALRGAAAESVAPVSQVTRVTSDAGSIPAASIGLVEPRRDLSPRERVGGVLRQTA
jgi:hypothetical protein